MLEKLLLPLPVLIVCIGFTEIAIANKSVTSIHLDIKDDQSFSESFMYDQPYALNVSLKSDQIRAVIVYAVSQGGNITISLDEAFSLDNSIFGLSVGTIKLVQNNHSNVLFYLEVNSFKNCTNASETINLVVTEQTSLQPIPGGCNLVHNANYYPLLSAERADESLWQLNFEPANVGFLPNETEPLCDVKTSLNKRLVYDVYTDFLPVSYENKTCCRRTPLCTEQQANSSLQRFTQMLTTHESRIKLKSFLQSNALEFAIAHNPCMNSIVHVVVRDPLHDTSSSYAPLVVLRNKLRTEDAASIYLHIIMIVVMVAALILCFVGHRFFAFEVFMFCLLFFDILSFIALEKTTSLILLDKAAISFGIGMICGLFFLALWWRFGHSQVYCIFISIVGGYLFSSIVFASPLINLSFFRNYSTFLAFFFMVLSIYLLLFVLISLPKSCIVTSAFVGSYLFIFGLSSDVYLCSELSFIAPFSLFRISNRQFHDAFVVYHFSTIDIALTATWVAMTIFGIAAQFRLLKSEPDFPQSPYILKNQQQQVDNPTIQVSTESDSFSSRGPSFTSENYDGDISDDLLGSVDLSGSLDVTSSSSSDTLPLIID